jgi:hypothetical protein
MPSSPCAKFGPQSKKITSIIRGFKNWDYSANGYYYITICTKNRRCFFGEIIKGEIDLSEIGNMAYQYWQEIPNHFPFVRLDEFVIMPNHIHGIIIIYKSEDEINKQNIDNITIGDAVFTMCEIWSSIQKNYINNSRF